MTRVGVLSDTHLPASRPVLDAEVLQALQGVELILHAGDSCCAEVLVMLESIAPVIAVHGNVDPPELQQSLPAHRIVERGGVSIGLTHGHLGRGRTTMEHALNQFADQPHVRVIVFGHSHVPALVHHRGILLFNPGSPTQPRAQPRPSLGILQILDGAATAEHVYLRRH